MNPIAELIANSPTPVVLTTAAETAYTNAEPDEVGGQPATTSTPHLAFFSTVTAAGVEIQDAKATLTMTAGTGGQSDMPAHGRLGTRVSVGQQDYQIVRIRERRLFGVLNGYVLNLD